MRLVLLITKATREAQEAPGAFDSFHKNSFIDFFLKGDR